MGSLAVVASRLAPSCLEEERRLHFDRGVLEFACQVEEDLQEACTSLVAYRQVQEEADMVGNALVATCTTAVEFLLQLHVANTLEALLREAHSNMEQYSSNDA